MKTQDKLVEYGKAQYNHAGITFSKVGDALLRWWAVILAVALVSGVLGFFSSMAFITPRYEASVNLIVNEQGTVEEPAADKKNKPTQVDTYAIIIKSDIVLDKVAENLGLAMNYQELSSMVTVAAIDNTQIMRVTVQSENASTSLSIVKEIATVAPAVIVDSLEASSCKVVSKARANSTQVFPNNTANAVFCAVLGMLITALVVVFKVLTKDTISNDQDVQAELGLPVLAVIHEVEGGR